MVDSYIFVLSFTLLFALCQIIYRKTDVVESFPLFFKEVFLNGFSVNEFDEFNFDRSQVKKARFPR